MFSNLTLNSIFWLILGVLLFAAGSYYLGYRMRMYPFAAGVCFLGIGSILLGITNGFTDYTPAGRLLWKIGVPTLLIGLALSIYYVLKFI